MSNAKSIYIIDTSHLVKFEEQSARVMLATPRMASSLSVEHGGVIRSVPPRWSSFLILSGSVALEKDKPYTLLLILSIGVQRSLS